MKSAKSLLCALLVLMLIPFSSLNVAAADKPKYNVIKANLKFDDCKAFSSDAFIVMSSNKYGCMNYKGNLVLPCEYDSISIFANGYAKIEKNKKFGLINSEGKITVPVKYDWLSSQEYSDMYSISYEMYLNTADKVDVAWVRIGDDLTGKHGLININTGKEVLPAKYDDVKCFFNGLSRVVLNGKYGFIDATGKVVVESKYDYASDYKNNVARVELNKKSGYIDTTGKIVLPIQYENVSSFTEGFAVIYEGSYPDTKYGCVDATGKAIVPLKYSNMNEYKNGLSIVGEGVYPSTKYGIVDNTGKIIIPIQYEFLRFDNDVIIAKKDGKTGIIDKTNKTIVSFSYDSITNFNGGLAIVTNTVNDQPIEGCIDITGKVIIPIQYDRVDYSTEKQSPNIDNGTIRVTAKNQYGLYDTNGKLLVPVEYDYIDYFNTETRASIKKDNQYGYIDKTGKIIVPIGYNVSTSSVPHNNYKNGYAVVGIDAPQKSDSVLFISGKQNEGLINSYGEIIIPIVYDSLVLLEKDYILVNQNKSWSLYQLISTAKPVKNIVSINGKSIEFGTYEINNVVYFKIRDLAFSLSETDKCFNVDYLKAQDSISIVPKTKYVSVGGELTVNNTTVTKNATQNQSPLYVNGKMYNPISYTIDGYNYYKLQDITQLLNINITTVPSTQQISID